MRFCKWSSITWRLMCGNYIPFLKYSPQIILPQCICYAYYYSHAHRLAHTAANVVKCVCSSCMWAAECTKQTPARAWNGVKALITESDSFHSFAHSCHLSYASIPSCYTPTPAKKRAWMALFIQRKMIQGGTQCQRRWRESKWDKAASMWEK